MSERPFPGIADYQIRIPEKQPLRTPAKIPPTAQPPQRTTLLIRDPTLPNVCMMFSTNGTAGFRVGTEIHFIMQHKVYVVTQAQRPAHSLPGTVNVGGVSNQDALLCGTQYTLTDYCRQYNATLI